MVKVSPASTSLFEAGGRTAFGCIGSSLAISEPHRQPKIAIA
jgi:hypothetical protein